MRASDAGAGALFSYADIERRGPRAHPLRAIRAIANETLTALSGEFTALYATSGRPSIPPERLLRALLLQAFDAARSERQLVERIAFDLVLRGFVGLGVDDPVWDATPLHPQPRPSAGVRDRGQGPGGADGPSAGQTAVADRALRGRRHADRGLGEHEERPAQGRLGRAAAARAQRRERLPWRGAHK